MEKVMMDKAMMSISAKDDEMTPEELRLAIESRATEKAYRESMYTMRMMEDQLKKRYEDDMTTATIDSLKLDDETIQAMEASLEQEEVEMAIQFVKDLQEVEQMVIDEAVKAAIMKESA